MIVNKYVCLTDNKKNYRFGRMKYGERLKAARTYAGLTQGELADRVKNATTQANISYLENSDATGSELTAQFAAACGINALWLATEEGAMISKYQTSDEKIIRAAMLMEQLPEVAKDHTIKEIAETAELIDHLSSTLKRGSA